MNKYVTQVLAACLILLGSIRIGVADEPELKAYPAAIFPFSERGAGAKGLGSTTSDLLFASLAANPNLFLVDREDIEKTLREQELSLSGMVSPAEAVEVGKLIGAKVLITGSVIDVGREIFVVARIVGTETSRVLGESVRGKTSDSIGDLIDTLGQLVGQAIAERAHELMAEVKRREDRIAAINAALGGAARPTLAVTIDERHVGRMPMDPAAEIEFIHMSQATGFGVIDAKAPDAAYADILIQGEGFSEFATRRGNMVSVKARLEVRAVDRQTGRVLWADRYNTVAVDLAEEIAGKAALQEAAAQIAERILPKLVAR